MAHRLLTLNVGASQATLAEYAVEGRRDLTLVAYGMAPLAAVDADAVGSMEAVLTPAIHGLMRETGIRPAPVVLSLNGQMVFPRFARFPVAGDAAKLDQMVRYEVEQNVPFPMDEIVWNHQFIGEPKDGERAAMIVAAKLEHVRGVTDAVRAAGLSPLVVDVAPMAIYNALRFNYPDLTGCTVVLDIGSRTTSLIIVEDEKVYIRSIPVAGNAITKELAQAFGCSLEEAEKLKVERGYVSMGGVSEDPDEVGDRISKVVRTVMTRLHAEIARSINFYRSQQGGNAPSRLFLTGGTALLPQLDQFFQETLQVEVQPFNPFQAVKVGPKVDATKLETDAFLLAESVGLALRRTDAAAMCLNLMPPELVSHKRAMRRIPYLGAAAACVLCALGAGILVADRSAAVYTAEGEAVAARRDRLQACDVKIKAALKDLAAEEARADELRALIQSRSSTLIRLDIVRRSLLPGMWITDWRPLVAGAADATASAPRASGDNGPDAAGNGVSVTIRGWQDQLAAAEAADASAREGKKRTAEEIVQENLRAKQPVVVADSVKIASQKDVGSKGCLTEFKIELRFAPLSGAPVSGRPGKKPSKKGGRQ